VDGHALELGVDHEPEAQAQHADEQPAHEEGAAVDSYERLGAEVGEDQAGLAALVNGGGLGGVLRGPGGAVEGGVLREGGGGQEKEAQQKRGQCAEDMDSEGGTPNR